jgi:hypothetical protein
MSVGVKKFSWALDPDAVCNPPGVTSDWHVFRHGWGTCVCQQKQWPLNVCNICQIGVATSYDERRNLAVCQNCGHL